MYGTIYDSSLPDAQGWQGLAFDAGGSRVPDTCLKIVGSAPRDAARIAIIYNPRSHGVKKHGLEIPPGVIAISPRTRPELTRALGKLAAQGIQLLIVAGGDGTVRDILTCGGPLWQENAPAIAVLPKGKTNALAIDLGVDAGWSVRDAIDAWQNRRITPRAPIELLRLPRSIHRGEAARPVRGFLLGAGIFVSATELAQTTHRFGAFNNLAVGLSILGSIANVAFGFGGAGWRKGMEIAIAAEGKDASSPVMGRRNRLIMMASTMHRLPLGVKPFGAERGGLKLMVADAPLPRFLRNFWRAIRDERDEKLASEGVHRIDGKAFDLDFADGFVLDGELFPAGEWQMREGAPVEFVTS